MADNGFFVYRDFLSQGQISKFSKDLRTEFDESFDDKSTCDAINHSDVALEFLQLPVFNDFIQAILKDPSFLQICDIQINHNRDNWHRDGACRTFGTGDWDESKAPYKVYKIIVYLDSEGSGLAVVPGSHKIKTQLGKVEDKLTNFEYIKSDKTADKKLYRGDKPKRPAFVEMKPGDILVFDERLLHCGRRLNKEKTEMSSTFFGRKATLAYVFGERNVHSWRFHSFFRHLRPELKYLPLKPKVESIVNNLSLWWEQLDENLFDKHPEELKNITGK